MRGKVQRHQINKVKNRAITGKNSNLFNKKPKTKRVLNIHINNIDMYSPKNNKANLDALYSVLKPDTNSDSPSAKSKGVRWLSLKHIINHSNPIGYNIKNKLV